MKIFFSFIGGNMGNEIVAGDSDVPMPEGKPDPATRYYLLSQRAEIDCQFPIVIGDGVETYQIVRRLGNNNVLAVWAEFVVEADRHNFGHILYEGRDRASPLHYV
jgi:hypothetical protein